jgi:hypothetical protein
MSDDRKLRLVSASGYIATRLSDVAPSGRSDWGPWSLDRKVRVLYVTEPSGYRYEVDLDRCLSSAEVLDWVCQIAGKTWADDATLAGLVRAIDDVLVPQANLCSSGVDKRMTVRQVTKQVRRAPR